MIEGNIDVLSINGDINDYISIEGTLLPIGPKGDKGDKGDPGFSPVVDMQKVGKTTILTITDATGPHETEIQDGVGDMEKSVYDTDNDGVVDEAERVNGHTVNTDVPYDAVFTDTTYTAGEGISISSSNVISNTQTSAEWGNITGTLNDQLDLKSVLNDKADTSLLSDVAFSGDYTDLTNTPTIPTVNDATLTIKKNNTNVGTFTANASSNVDINITVPTTASDVGAVPTSSVGTASGVAELDANGKVPSSQLPSYVDDVIEGYYKVADGKFYKESTYTTEIPGETGKIYISVDTNKSYRWTGSGFAEISSSLALGETSSTAYRGDRGKIAYDHSQTTSGNPHNVSKSDVGLGNVGNFKAVSTEASQGLSSTEQANARANISAVGTSDYAVNGGSAGIIKVGDTYGGKVDASGNLYARQLNYIDYVGANDNIFVSKGTLKAVLIGKGYTTPEVSVGTTTPSGDEVLWIDPNNMPSGSGSYITNQYSVATDKGYSANYINNNLSSKVLYENATGAGQEANLVLSDNVDNYTYFLFLGFDKDDANTGIQMFFFKQPNSKLRGDKCEVSSTGYSITTRIYTYSGKNLTFNSQYYYTLQQGSVFSYPNFRVQKVIGYK